MLNPKRTCRGLGKSVAIDPSATWTAEIFQRKLSFEPPSDNCILLMLLWGEQCDGEISFKELPLFR